ncbi:Peptide chain release factor 1 [Streptomyces griseomycini]
MFEAVEELVAEHADLEKKLADPSVHSDQANARKLNKRYAELTPIVATYRSWKQTGDDIETARELAADDPDFAAEVKELDKQREELTEKLRLLLVPRDPSDDKDVILEIKAGAGGDESALFAGDLLRMYLRYAERVGWKTEIIDATESELGGYKDVQVAVKTKGGQGATEPRPGRLGPAEVRGRRAPRAARPGHRVPGPHPHLGGGRPRDPRGRGDRRRDQPQRPAHRRVPVLRTRRPVGQHHRLRRAHHAHPDRCRRLLPEREEPAPEQGAGDAYPALQAARRGAGRGGEGGGGRPAQPGAHRRPLREDRVRTTSRRTASRTTASASRRTTSTRSWTATSTR